MKQNTLFIGCLLATTIFGACHEDTLQPLNQGKFAAPPETVAVQIMGYQPAPGNVFKDLFVSNFSVKAAVGVLSLSTARDGLGDGLKQGLAATFGFNAGTNPYSANPGFSDLLLYDMGVTFSQQPLLSCATNLQQSSTNDAFVFQDTRNGAPFTAFLGLRDCEKQYLGLNTSLFDNSRSGIPDYLKIRCGLNPKDPNDVTLSPAADGVTNYEKCKQHIPIDESAASQPNILFAYKYDFEVHADGTQNLAVSNIAVLNHGQDNLIAIYLTEENLTTKANSLFTAFAILPTAMNGRTLRFNYWATDPTKYTNQEIIPQ